MSRPVSAVRYGCSVRGRCERDEVNGRYTSLADCERDCQGAESADLIYLILSYDWTAATTATPSDQQHLLYQEFGLTVSAAEAVRVVKLLAKGHIYELLLTSPVFEDYLSSSLSDFTLFALEVVFLFSQQVKVTIPDWQTFERHLRSTRRRRRYTRRPNDDGDQDDLDMAPYRIDEMMQRYAYYDPVMYIYCDTAVRFRFADHPELIDDLYQLVKARF